MNIVVVISGNGSNLQAIIDAQQAGQLKSNISGVVSNRPNAFGLERAQKAGIPTSIVDHTDFSDRESFEQSYIEAIDAYQPDWVILAGFMRILTPLFVRHYKGRMLNIHPSLLPKYPGLHTHQSAIDAGDSEHGASIHFVTEELDDGPAFLQGVVPILENDTAESLAQRVHQIEHIIYPEAIRWCEEGRLQWQETHCTLDNQIVEHPHIMTLD